MSPEQERRELGRRRLLQVLGASGGAAVLSTKWAKPIVDMVVLPVHAQAPGTPTVPPPPELVLDCEADPASGSAIFPGTFVTVTITARETLDGQDVGPVPDLPITWQTFCNGAVQDSGMNNTDATGQLTLNLDPNPCSANETYRFEGSNEGLTTTCFWVTSVTTTTPPPPDDDPE